MTLSKSSAAIKKAIAVKCNKDYDWGYIQREGTLFITLVTKVSK